jgi:lipid-A-disaccharide synthase
LSPRLLLSCGEASGDLYAGALTRALLALDPSLRIAGLGGPQFAAAGGELVDDYRKLSVTGLTEWIPKLPRLLAARRRLVEAAQAQKPDALVLIDFSGFNFRLAPAIKALGVPVIYYISPQIWASRPKRIETIRRIADRMLVIFPFESEIYEKAGVPVEFVGHPLLDLAKPSATREEFLRARGLTPSAPTIAMLPGSRTNEVSRILPDLAAAAELIRGAVPGAQFVVARAPHLDDALFEPVTRRSGAVPFTIVEGDTDTVLASADVTLTASGTATVQAALHDTPMVVVYRMAPLSYQLARRVVRLESIAMVNLIAGEALVPELIQDAFTPAAVAREAVSMLTDRERATRIRTGLAAVRTRLGGPGGSRRAAEAILRIVTHGGGADPRVRPRT